MTDHRTGTREEWLAARLELLEAEKALTRRSDELARRRQELPWVRIDKAYRFETDEGTAFLADLFRGRSQLLIYHFMFGPDYSAGCPSCSTIADGFNGFVVHLANHDVTLLAVSRAALAELAGEGGFISHTYSPYARGLDGLWGMYQWLDRAPNGRNETGVWWRRHDEYDTLLQNAGSCCHAAEAHA